MPHRTPSDQGPSAQVFVVDTIELLISPLQVITPLSEIIWERALSTCHSVFNSMSMLLILTRFIIILSIDLLPLMLQIPTRLPVLPPAVVLSPQQCELPAHAIIL